MRGVELACAASQEKIKKFWGDFTKMYHFHEKVSNFSKIFSCGGLFYVLYRFINLFQQLNIPFCMKKHMIFDP